MNLETLLRSADPERLAAGGRDVGRLMATKLPVELDALRRQIDGIQRATATGDERRRGFLEGLEMVASGFARERERVDTLHKDLELIRSRRHWLATLNLIDAGTVNPRAIAQQLSLSEPSISKILGELEEAGLIEHSEAAAGGARAKPRMLTIRAHALLANLSRSEATASVEQVVNAVTSCFPSLLTNRRESKHSLEKQLEEALGASLAPTALKVLIDSLERQGVASMEADESFVVHSLEQIRDLDVSLHDALKEQSPIPWVEQRTVPLYLRTTRDEWDVLLPHSQVSAAVQVVRDDDLEQGEFSYPQGEYEVLYESALLAKADQQNEQHRQLSERASRCWYLALPDRSSNLENCTPVSIPEFFKRGA
jgi:DNA-binding MarR family transcriptional regulator